MSSPKQINMEIDSKQQELPETTTEMTMDTIDTTMDSNSDEDSDPDNPSSKYTHHQLEEARLQCANRLKRTWESIFSRYENVDEEEDDVINLETETIEVDRGNIRKRARSEFGTMLDTVLANADYWDDEFGSSGSDSDSDPDMSEKDEKEEDFSTLPSVSIPATVKKSAPIIGANLLKSENVKPIKLEQDLDILGLEIKKLQQERAQQLASASTQPWNPSPKKARSMVSQISMAFNTVNYPPMPHVPSILRNFEPVREPLNVVQPKVKVEEPEEDDDPLCTYTGINIPKKNPKGFATPRVQMIPSMQIPSTQQAHQVITRDKKIPVIGQMK